MCCVNKVFLATACCISVVSTSGSADILLMDTKVTYHWNLPDWLFYLFRTCKVSLNISKLKPKDNGRDGTHLAFYRRKHVKHVNTSGQNTVSKSPPKLRKTTYFF